MHSFLTTEIKYNGLNLKVFVKEENPIYSSEENFYIYPITLMDKDANIYGNMCYSVSANHLEILQLEKTQASACYVGTALVEWILLKSYALGKEGNLGLTSAYGSYVFWYPLGFRSNDEYENIAIMERIALRKSETPTGQRITQIQEEGDLSFTFMHLPSESKANLLKQFNKTTHSPLISLGIFKQSTTESPEAPASTSAASSSQSFFEPTTLQLLSGEFDEYLMETSPQSPH